MTKKTGRNDPCPCGSGKKYKSCCMKKEEEQTVAKYTASGKRKFKARVLSLQDSSASIFAHSTSVQQIPTKSETLEKLKFRQTTQDFRTEEVEEPIQFKRSEEKPQERERSLPAAEESFTPTSEDYREKK